MTREEAVARIKDHIEIHRYHERNAVKIFEALDIAIKALEQPEPCEDAVSRKEAVREAKELFKLGECHADEYSIIGMLNSLPSVQPELHYDEWCDDCKEYDKERHCCPRWNRVIRQALKDAQPEQRWIPCSETVDIPNHEVLACDLHGEMMFGYLAYDNGQWFCESYGDIMYDTIAWREKPEPYKERRE